MFPCAVVVFWGLLDARIHAARMWPGLQMHGQHDYVHDFVRSLLLMVAGTGFVTSGSMMAPRLRIVAAILLVVIFITYFSHFAQQGEHYFDVTVESLGAFAGAAWIYYSERSKRNALRPADQTG